MKITHYDLFAGIGGFSLALDTIFYDSEIKHIFCEWEAFPTAILRKHWPDGTYYGDIADLVADTNIRRRDTQSLPRTISSSKEDNNNAIASNITIVTGGFPCQPFSHAGRRQGTADNRYLWPQMFAVIRNVRPDWVIAENVRGLVTWNDGMVLETVCADLESKGYEVQPLVIPAVAIGAPHRRDRVWIVAHANRGEQRAGLGRLQEAHGEIPERDDHAEPCNAGTVNGFTSNSVNHGQGGEERGGVATPYSVPQEHREEDSAAREFERTTCDGYDHRPWETDWREVALATCHDRMDDGLPRWMDGVTISASRHRKERLKACGNAIVPQVAMEIFSAIRVVIHTP